MQIPRIRNSNTANNTNEPPRLIRGIRLRNSPYSRWSGSGGFTLLETLVGMTILIIAVTGTLSIISRNVSSAAIAKENVTAFYLAQEALEFVRGVRDNNAINAGGGGNWLQGLEDCGEKCTIDVNAASESDLVESCGFLECPKLLLNMETGVYGYGSGAETIFTREIVITETASDREARIDATVKWEQGSVPREFTLTGTIFNWR